MSLRHFHLVFILAATLWAFGFAAWVRFASDELFPAKSLWTAAALGVGALLLFYLVWFLKKEKVKS